MLLNEKESYQANNTLFEFYRLMRKLSREIEKFREKHVADYKLSGAEYYILRNVYKVPKCTYTELAKQSGVAKNTISVLVKSLLRQGYLQQYADPNDGRLTRLMVTTLGDKLVEEVILSGGYRATKERGSTLFEVRDVLMDERPQNVLEKLGEIIRLLNE